MKRRIVMSKELHNKLISRLEDYRKAISNVGFASYEINRLPEKLQTEEDILAALDVIIDSSKELNFILEEAPNSFLVCDAEANCLRVNKTFIIAKDEILGQNLKELDEAGIFRPSVCYLALKAQRSVSVLQEINDIKNLAVTGVPVFDEKGHLFRAVTNAIKIDEVEPIAEYIRAQQHDIVYPEPVNIITESEAMKRVIEFADIIKNTNSSVMITGETGVGKGVIASYIHETSRRADGRLISISCGAIPENLLESELFGYESGAFTGADKKGKPGLIELSSGGTLFLDEISELPRMLQVKILSFIQSKKIMRVGGTEEIHVDTRIIAACNKSLEEEVQNGTFRSDLYYRINVIPIKIPPLRERKEDLMALASHFLDYYCGKYNRSMKFSEETLDYIKSYNWPGNVRELENYVERMVVTNDDGRFLTDGDIGGIAKTPEETTEEEFIKNLYEKY
jgi:transcriptional regulator with PAS, ATPase and Fis domain